MGSIGSGKSSLLNALVHPKKLFRTGSTPGLTRGLIGVEVMLGRRPESTLEIVDVPGFGFALKSNRGEWEGLAQALLEKSEDKGLLFLWLIDITREPDGLDYEVIRWLGPRPFKILYTKADQVKKHHRPKYEAKWSEFVEQATEHPLWVSSLSGEGIPELGKVARNFLR
jgi:GTP-binding protein EngB required for normal cell division